MVNLKEIFPLCDSMKASGNLSTEVHLDYAEADEESHAKQYREMAPKVEMEEELVELSVKVKGRGW